MKRSFKILSLTMSIIFILSCENKTELDLNNELKDELFLHNFILVKDTLFGRLEVLNHERQISSYSNIVGSNRDKDTLFQSKILKSIYREQDYPCFIKAYEFELFVDTSLHFIRKFSKDTTYFMETTGIGVRKDISTYHEVYSLLIKNQYSDTSQILLHDGQLMIVQEALDSLGAWRPIEYFELSGCGNSYFNSTVYPNEILVSFINKYEGNFKTKLRAKLKTGDSIFYSNEYFGSINFSQLESVDNWNVMKFHHLD